MEFGVVGLGRIGGGLAWQALRKGMRVVGFATDPASEELTQAGLEVVAQLGALPAALSGPRVILLYVPAGKAVDDCVDALLPHLNQGDILVDGGNSYWGDSIRRHARLAEHGIHWCDVGTSGGFTGARTGVCFMAGGPSDALDVIEPILRALSVPAYSHESPSGPVEVPAAFVRCGGPGSGHFVKLVHNGIEFGMLQAIGEGIDLLEHYHEALPVADVLAAWRNGSVVRSWLIDLMHEKYVDRGGMDAVEGYIDDTGEVNWLVADAMRMEVPTPIITQSVVQLLASRDQSRAWAKAIALMRQGFGGHPVHEVTDPQRHKSQLKGLRQQSRVGDIYDPELSKD